MKLTQLQMVERAFEDVCEAEAIQAPAGKDETYWCLIRAHSELLKARNNLRGEIK